MEKKPSAGKTTAIVAVSVTQLETLLMWVAHLYGFNDMPPEVAGAIVGIAMAIAGAVMHVLQRDSEKKEARENAQTNGVTGGPAPQ